jgi:2-polyprenyl-6-methoxyphenol hydroxylase-like FAD-dependent oxidoreductase
VAGGGPAGLAAAVAARRRGFDVTVADCSVPPIDKACGEGIMPDGLGAARALGFPIEQAAARIFRGIRFVENGASIQADFPHGHGLGIRRTALHGLMVDCAAAAGVRFLWGSRIGGITGQAVSVDNREVRARWIIGADGGRSAVRRWAGLERFARNSRRFAFRRHYGIAPWSDFMEIHWSDHCQIYVTPVADREICVVVISRDPHLRLDDALLLFPELRGRLSASPQSSQERGGVSVSRRLRSVAEGRVALVGDASGSVDAITGEGLCLLFQHAVMLAEALEAGDLAQYDAAHRRLGRRPALMADLILMLDGRRRLRTRTFRAMASDPRLFSRLLAMHVGELSMLDFAASGLDLGWRLLTA